MFSNNPLGLVYICGGAAADGTQIQQRPIASSNSIFHKSNSIFEKSKTEIEPILYENEGNARPLVERIWMGDPYTCIITVPN